MSGDHDPAIRLHLARKDRDYVAQLDVLVDARSFWNRVSVKAYFEARAVAFELIEDPLPRGADAAIGLGRIRKSVARFEAFELLQDFGDAVSRNLGDDLLNLRIEPRGRHHHIILPTPTLTTH